MIFLIWLDEDDADMVEEEDVDTCWVVALLLLLLAIMFFISAIEFCISPRHCLMSTAELDVELDCFEEEDEEDDEDLMAEDMRRCVEDVLAIRAVVVEELLVDEDTCLLLELLLFRSSCAAEVLIAVVPEVLPLANDDDDDAFEEPNRLWQRVGGVGGPIIPVLLPVSVARSDISRRGNRNCDRRVATDGPERLMTILSVLLLLLLLLLLLEVGQVVCTQINTLWCRN